jgi:hypothetical protein
MEGKINRTYSIDVKVFKDFKIECIYQNVEMSETIENFMLSFSNVSKQSRIKSDG